MEGSAFRRGAAIAAAGGGRPSASTNHEQVLAASSKRAEHLEYLATREAQAMQKATLKPSKRQRLEALRWQLSGVTEELEMAQEVLRTRKGELAKAEQTWRIVLVAARSSAW